MLSGGKLVFCVCGGGVVAVVARSFKNVFMVVDSEEGEQKSWWGCVHIISPFVLTFYAFKQITKLCLKINI